MLREEERSDRAGALGTPRSRLSAAEINPYTRWVHEHPAVLLADPTPAALAEHLATATGPIVVDLGCGAGNFLLERARREPGLRFVGFELRYKRLVKAARKVERAGLRNVWFLREAAERLADYFPAGSLAAVHVNFPDPWPRRSEWKKRLVNRALLEALQTLLQPGGEFLLKTDDSGYFLHALSLLREVPGLRLSAFSNDHHRLAGATGEAPTEFELLFQAQRKPVYSLRLRRPPAG